MQTEAQKAAKALQQAQEDIAHLQNMQANEMLRFHSFRRQLLELQAGESHERERLHVSGRGGA